MGIVGRWIDGMCEHQPELMQKVLEREFGKLETYINEDGCSGCLIGTTLLASSNGKVEGLFKLFAVNALSNSLLQRNLGTDLRS